MALSDTWLKANSGKPRSKASEKADRDGLSVRLSPKGKVTFQMRYRFDGTPKRLDIGTYPLLSLKQARTESQRLRAKLEQGHDPKVVRLVEKQAIATANSIEDLFRQWYQSYCKPNKASHKEILRSFELHILPRLGHLPAESVTLHAWLELLEEKAQEAPAITSRILTNAKQMLKWGVKRQLIPANPIADINAKSDLQIRKNIGTRSLTHEEIRYFWMAVEKSRIAAKNKLFLKLNLFYGCRNGELRLSKKEHFDFNSMVWSVPPENHKMGSVTKRPLLRPIIAEVKPLIEEAFRLSGKSKFAFTNLGTDEPMGTNAQLSLPYNVRQWLRRRKDYEMEHWSVHDLRKTARTNFSELTEPHIAEIMLGHKLPGQWQVYDHYDYLKEQADAYAKWWARMMEIVETDH